MTDFLTRIKLEVARNGNRFEIQESDGVRTHRIAVVDNAHFLNEKGMLDRAELFASAPELKTDLHAISAELAELVTAIDNAVFWDSETDKPVIAKTDIPLARARKVLTEYQERSK